MVTGGPSAYEPPVAAGSPSDQVTDSRVAVAVTDTPPAAAVAVRAPGLSVQSQVQRFTARRLRSGPALTCGAGTRSCLMARCAITSGSGGGGAVARTAFGMN